MRVTAAVLYDVKKPLVVEDVDLLEPGPHEVLVRWKANGVGGSAGAEEPDSRTRSARRD